MNYILWEVSWLNIQMIIFSIDKGEEVNINKNETDMNFNDIGLILGAK